MQSKDYDDRSRTPAGGRRKPPSDALSTVTTLTYAVNESASTARPMPERTPISGEEMDSLMTLLGNVRTRLLWLHCEWAEEARQGRLSPAELEAKAAGAFEKLRGQFIAHLLGCEKGVESRIRTPAVRIRLPTPFPAPVGKGSTLCRGTWRRGRAPGRMH